MVMVIDLIVSDTCKGCAGLVEVSWFKAASRFCKTCKASSKSISSQFTIFANGMLIAFEHISVSEFVGNDGKRAEISIALSDLIS